MLIDLNNDELLKIMIETSNDGTKIFMDRALKYDIDIIAALNILNDYINEFEPLHIQDVRELLNGGTILLIDSLKDIDLKDYYACHEIKPGVFLLIE